MPRFTRVLLLVAPLLLLIPVTAEAQTEYRLFLLRDVAKMAGTDAEGLPAEELPRRVSSYALHLFDGRFVGLAARFYDDPDGPVVVAWRDGDQPWRSAWLDSPGIGELAAFRPLTQAFVIDLRKPDTRVASVLLDANLALVVVVDGRIQRVTPAPDSDGAITLDVRVGEQDRTLTCVVTTAPRRQCR
jgi:tRNA-binding EMAP/Myf-like protein